MTSPSASIVQVPTSIREPFREALVAASEAWAALQGPRLVSMVLFGTVARGQAGSHSDVPQEARYHVPLYLDMVEDGILLVDRCGFFGAVLRAIRARMHVLGSRRVFLPDGSWYWDSKPDFTFGDVVEL